MEVYSGTLPKLHAQSECRCPPSHPRVHPLVERYRTTLHKYYHTMSFYSCQPLLFSLYLLFQLILPARTEHLNRIKVIIVFEIERLMSTPQRLRQQQRTSDLDRSLWKCQKHWQTFKIYPKIQDVNIQLVTRFAKSSAVAWKETTDVLFDVSQNTIRLMMIDVNV